MQDDDDPYSEKDYGNVMNVIWLAIGFMLLTILSTLAAYVIGWR